MKAKKVSFLMRVIEFPKELDAFITAGIMGAVVWLEVFLAGVLGISLDGIVAPVGVALAAVFTYVAKALLERWVPEQFHGMVNSALAWLATFLGGLAVWNLLG